MRVVHESERITVYIITDEAEAKAKAEADKKRPFPPKEIIPWKGEDGADYLTYVW